MRAGPYGFSLGNEKKGQHLNQQSFNAYSKQLLDIHTQALSSALDELIPEIAMDDVPFLGDGQVSQRIVHVLKTIPITEELLKKQIAY